jgi:hypothetical protein
LNLKKVDGYKYLKQSCCYSIAGVDDAQMFRTVTVLCFFYLITWNMPFVVSALCSFHIY